MATIITSAEALGGMTQGDYYFDGTDYHLMTEKGLIRVTYLGSGSFTSPTLASPIITSPTISAPTITGEITSNALQATEHGAGLIGTSSFGAPKTYRRTENGIIITTINFDLTGLASEGTTEDAI